MEFKISACKGSYPVFVFGNTETHRVILRVGKRPAILTLKKARELRAALDEMITFAEDAPGPHRDRFQR